MAEENQEKSQEPEKQPNQNSNKEAQDTRESSQDKDKTVDISLNMKQVALAAFSTGLIIGIILTGAIFISTNLVEDLDTDQTNQLDVNSYNAGIGTDEDNFEWTGGSVNLQERPYIGDSGADITIVSYEDFSCVWCARHNTERAMPQLLDNEIEDGEVQYFYKHFPRTEVGQEAAEASVCILNQGDEKFWQAKEYFFNNFQRISQGEFDSVLDEALEGLDLDQEEFDSCYQGESAEFVNADHSEAQNFDYELEDGRDFVSGTPSFIIYNHETNEAEAFAGAQPYEEFQEAIE